MSSPIYAKIVSVGDVCPQGFAPITMEGSDNIRRVILIDQSQCRYLESRFNAINSKQDDATQP